MYLVVGYVSVPQSSRDKKSMQDVIVCLIVRCKSNQVAIIDKLDSSGDKLSRSDPPVL